MNAERIAARGGWGYPPPNYELTCDDAPGAEGLYGAGARAKLTASGLWSEPVDLAHRYVTEDAALGLTLLESAARTVGAETPAMSGLLLVFGTLLGRRSLVGVAISITSAWATFPGARSRRCSRRVGARPTGAASSAKPPPGRIAPAKPALERRRC